MCRTGGPRCKGTGRQTSKTSKTSTGTASPTAAPSVDTVSTPLPSGVPTREQVDRMAAEREPGKRTIFGQPETEADKRFFALRESGYKGPIDQNGYPDTTSDGAAILRRMAHNRGEHTDW